MNRKKYNLKCQELKSYEENFLHNMRNYFSSAKNELAKKNLSLDIDLIFCRRSDFEQSFERIDFCEDYMCFLGIQIRYNTDPYRDLDLEAICFQEPITQIGRSLFTGLMKFAKCPQKYIKEFVESVEKWINRVINEGYDKILKEINFNKRN